MGEVRVRLYAAAAEAAGSYELRIETAEDRLPLSELINTLTEQRALGVKAGAAAAGQSTALSLQHVCAQSSFLINGTRADKDSAEVTTNDIVDVLPPFAGG